MPFNWSGWTNFVKPYDFRQRPFHRVKSPSFAKQPGRAPGDALSRNHQGPFSCRLAPDIDKTAKETALTILTIGQTRDPRELIKTTPSWVPVDATDPARVEEAEGVVIRSYQTWTDFPVLQYHQWYDWNFFFDVHPDYGYLRSVANTAPTLPDSDNPAFTIPVIRDLDDKPAQSMECEMDCGAFGPRGPGGDITFPDPRLGPMFGRQPSRFEDWCWPQPGHMLWIKGRWIYDCGHPNQENINGLVRSELHPVKALATARNEAVAFPENGGLFTPGLQFMFFATKHGGYANFDTLREADVEFIVDLPPVPSPQGQSAIGHALPVPQNTVVERPRSEFLFRHTHDPFVNAGLTVAEGTGRRAARVATVAPVVTLITPTDPARPQVRLVVPMSQIPDDADIYGFVLSLGWTDPDKSQARRVKKVTVSDIKLVAARAHDDLSPGEWQVKVGINGRWMMKHQEGISAGTEIPFTGARLELFLSEDDLLVVSCHGEELDDVHEVYTDKTEPQRTLALNGVAVRYETEILRGNLATARELVTGIEDVMGSLAQFPFQESQPLGRIDPFHRTSNSEVNPLGMANNMAPTQFQLRARLTTEVGTLAELAEDPNQLDYTMLYTLKIEPQNVP